MDIIVKREEGIFDPNHVRNLSPGETSSVWRSPRPSDANIRLVFFVRRGGEIFFWATYGGYGQVDDINLQGSHQSGEAIILALPFGDIDPPLTIPGCWYRGPWRWRYDRWNLRQRI